MIDRRSFLGSVAASTLLALRSEARNSGNLRRAVSDFDAGGRLIGPIPVPKTVKGVRDCVIDLGGTWYFSADKVTFFNGDEIDRLSWTPVQMPNELEMQGISIKPDVEYLLRRAIEIPLDFSKKSIIVRFDGAYSYARVWINGHYVRDHHGGFTSWECDITPYVRVGELADLVVVLADRSDDPSGGSQYAKHSIAGLLRDIRLLALPLVHSKHLHVTASLDDTFRSGLLDIQVLLNRPSRARISISLTDPRGELVPISQGKLVHDRETLRCDQIVIPSVIRWDSEHPNLYQLTIELRIDDDAQTFTRSIGFRRIDRVGNEIRVNGERVLLRGICRHDIHPTRGRAPSLENDERDPALLRKAHINFVRTSHYPPTEAFLAACDRAGIYVEEETAVCFVQQEVAANSALRERFLSQFSDMLARDHWHPSVILWSLGNESAWGANFVSELKLVRQADPSRPVIFSWSDSTGADQRLLDIYSSHYPVWDSDLGSNDQPILHDEFAHVACYITDDLQRDPGLRNFWGRSIAEFGRRFFEAPGCLGGAIWAGIDEVYLLPNRVTGYGPWGILDGWRREKPEFWLTRKAYSPIRIEDRPLPLPQTGDELLIPVRNGHNHTNLNELTIEWDIGQQRGRAKAPDIAPHTRSELRIPAGPLNKGQLLNLAFRAVDGSEVDRFILPIGERQRPTLSTLPAPLRLLTTTEAIEITAARLAISINCRTGLINLCKVNGRTVLEGGPYLSLGRSQPAGWSAAQVEVKQLAETVLIVVKGKASITDDVTSAHDEIGESVNIGAATPSVKQIEVEYEMEISGNGQIDFRYRLSGRSEIDIKQMGLCFILPSAVDRLTWERQALWSVYPADHIGRPAGTAQRASSRSPLPPRTAPDRPWAEDIEDSPLEGNRRTAVLTTNDFRSLKENVLWAACFEGDHPEHVRIESQGDAAVRASVAADEQVELHVYNCWSFPRLAFGNYPGLRRSSAFIEETIPPSFRHPFPERKITLRLSDTAPSLRPE